MPPRSPGIAALAVVLGTLSLPASARADTVPSLQPKDGVDGPRYRSKELPAPRLPAPFVLPELSHPRPDARLDWFLGRMSPENSARPASTIALARVSGEMSVLLPRKLYVGVLVPFGAALPPDGAVPPGYENEVLASGTRGAIGNLEAHVRAVFALPSFLEYGFLLGV